MALHVTARFVARDDSRESLKRILITLVDPIRRDPGCERCHFTQSQGQPNEFLFIEEWQSKAALERHLGEDFVRQALAETAALLAQDVELIAYDALS